MKKRNQRVRIKDVAEHAGVSYAVASLALSGKTHATVKYSQETSERIQAAANELGYRPNRSARNFVQNRHGSIGVVIQNIYDIPPLTLNAISMQAMENDLLVVIDRVSGPDATPRCLQEDMVDGVLLIGMIAPGIGEKLQATGLPVVQVNTNKTNGDNVITYAEDKAVRMLVEAAANRGRKRIAMLPSTGSHYSSNLRRQALIENSLEFGLQEPVFPMSTKTDYHELTIDHLEDVITGCDMIITSERILPKIYGCCHNLGRRIGDDISVLCFQPNWTAGMSMPKTAGIGLDQYHVGRLAFETLAKAISGQSIPCQVLEYIWKEGGSL